MKKILITSCLVASTLLASDYSSMTLDEMLTQRGNIAVEDRDAFKSEMQNKMKDLTPEQRAELRGSKGQGKGSRGGSGAGNMYKGSKGSGGGMGGRY